jgi:methyl-accepting chemotaxis protein
MLVTKLLEEPIGEIFNKYKTKWFGEDGSFQGIDAILETMDEFTSDMNAVGESFGAAYETIADNLKDYFANDERDGTSQGIATASQESVDENNARLTTIQAHTYTLVQGVQELNTTGNMMLERLTGIENNTREGADSLEDMRTQMRSMRETLDDIQLKGIKVK